MEITEEKLRKFIKQQIKEVREMEVDRNFFDSIEEIIEWQEHSTVSFEEINTEDLNEILNTSFSSFSMPYYIVNIYDYLIEIFDKDGDYIDVLQYRRGEIERIIEELYELFLQRKAILFVK